jgi:hypothetical protein
MQERKKTRTKTNNKTRYLINTCLTIFRIANMRMIVHDLHDQIIAN